MERSSKTFLEQFMAVPSPSGAEHEAARIWTAYAKKFAAKIEKDSHGNVMAVLNPKGSPRVMLAGHMDEIGFMITHITDEGFLHFAGVGGHDRQVIQGMRVNVLAEKESIKGLLGKKPVHLMSRADADKVPEMSDLWIDIGATDGKEARKRVAIGDVAVVDYGYLDMPNGLAVARGFDDKIGAFVVIEALRLLARRRPAAAVFAVATVQEEVGLRGARTSAFGIDPDVGVAVDVTHATDYPGVGGKERARVGNIKLGAGPSITRGPNINPKVFTRLVEAAGSERMKYQVEGNPGGTGTDANAIQISRGGVATGLVSVPNRYMHTPCEMISLADVEACARLLAAFVIRLGRRDSFIPSEP